MKKFVLFLAIIALLVIPLSACVDMDSLKVSDTGITGIDIRLDDSLELEAKTVTGAQAEKKGSLFVTKTKDFSPEDIQFVTSDSSVVTFEYDESKKDYGAYYIIKPISAGEATIYAQTKDGIVKSKEVKVHVTGYNYEIASVDDISTASAKRYRVRATVPESLIENRTNEYITDVMKYIATRYAKYHKVNSVTVFLYIDGDNTANGYTVGQLTYAPYGDISKSSEVSAGDYSTFDIGNISIFSAETRDALRGK